MSMTPREFMEKLNEQLQSDPARTADLTAVFQFELDGDAGGSWWIEAKDGTGAVHQGQNAEPTSTVRMTDETFTKMSSGELDGTEAYMDGLLTVEGDQGKVMFLPQVFGEQ
jgi:putative sterol carrier protein